MEALTAATRAEDCTDAFDGLERYHRGATKELLQCMRHRALSIRSSTTLHRPVPAPSCTLNIEVACKIVRFLQLSFDICLIVELLGGATHLEELS